MWNHGGYATRAAVVEIVGRREFDAAVRDGEIVWVSRGRYGLPGIPEDVLTAHGTRGVLSHVSAALWHRWEVKMPPAATHVTVPQRRRLAPSPGLVPHFVDLGPDDVEQGIATSWRRTLLDCARTLPADEALTICDSALRHGVPRSLLDDIARSVAGRGRPAVKRAMTHATMSAANPFESCLRSIALDVVGLEVVPQVVIVGRHTKARPDLVDERLRVVVEAESFGWHGDRAALRKDARRYNLLVVDGWLVLRFTWEDVMHDPDYVRETLQELVDARRRVLAQPACHVVRRPA